MLRALQAQLSTGQPRSTSEKREESTIKYSNEVRKQKDFYKRICTFIVAKCSRKSTAPAMVPRLVRAPRCNTVSQAAKDGSTSITTDPLLGRQATNHRENCASIRRIMMLQVPFNVRPKQHIPSEQCIGNLRRTLPVTPILSKQLCPRAGTLCSLPRSGPPSRKMRYPTVVMPRAVAKNRWYIVRCRELILATASYRKTSELETPWVMCVAR